MCFKGALRLRSTSAERPRRIRFPARNRVARDFRLEQLEPSPSKFEVRRLQPIRNPVRNPFATRSQPTLGLIPWFDPDGGLARSWLASTVLGWRASGLAYSKFKPGPACLASPLEERRKRIICRLNSARIKLIIYFLISLSHSGSRAGNPIRAFPFG